MTYEQAIDAANGGNLDAIKMIGDYHFERKEISDATDWYHKGAEKGDLYSAKRGASFAFATANASEKIQDWNGAVEYWGKFRDCQLAVMVLQKEVLATEEVVKIFATMNHALYRQGVACIQMGRNDFALKYLQAAAQDNEYVIGDADAKKLLAELR